MPSEQSKGIMRLAFCATCGELLGVEDHIRIRSEHFVDAGHRGMKLVEYGPTGASDEDMHARRAGWVA